VFGRLLVCARIKGVFNVQEGEIKEWEEKGTWVGVTAVNTWSMFCTENLNTKETNCPLEYRHKVKNRFFNPVKGKKYARKVFLSRCPVDEHKA
jgi:hypothetical protein